MSIVTRRGEVIMEAVDVRRRRRGRLTSSTEVTVTYGQERWAAALDADVLAVAVADALLVHTRETTLRGVDPQTGAPKRPLSPKTRRRSRKGPRGVRTGFFVDTIRRSGARGSTATATVRIAPDPRRNVFVAMEHRRGVEYFAVEGLAGDVISRVVDQFMKEAIDAK